MTSTTYGLRTCANCGAKRPANEMRSKSVRAGGATFKSRKSVTPMTLVGGLLGSKKASGALESWLFNTSNRRGSAKTYKQVSICTTCHLKPDFSSYKFSIFFIFKIPYWCVKLSIQLFFSAIKLAVLILTNPKIYLFLWAQMCNLVGLTAMGGKRAIQLANERSELKRVRSLSDEEALKEAFSSESFTVIANYVMMSRMAKVDGDFSRDEKRFINSSLDIDSTSIAIGERVLISDDLSNIFIDLIASKDGVDKKFSRQLVTNLFELARIDGTVDDAELNTLENFSKKLGLTAPDFNKLKAQAREETLELGGTFNPSDMDSKIAQALAKN